ncbi:hypothetical protein ACFJGV_15095 [Cnuibacter sp. UC19_7]|uniref:hypothetical protein n=1 Tax=Cnuibacter sp. UC19_7 TaxID=3350166 RepID=UPI00366BA809
MRRYDSEVVTLGDMGNPARELLDVLNGWAELQPGVPIYANRADETNGHDVEFWRAQAEAVRLVRRVDLELDARARAGRKTDHYYASLLGWYRGVFAPDIHWGAGSSSYVSVIDASAMNILASLADVLDERPSPIALSQEQRSNVSEGLDEVLDLLGSDEVELDDDGRAYVASLSRSIRAGIAPGADAFAGAELVRSINELTGAVTSVADALDQAGSPTGLASRLRAAVRKLSPYAGFAAGALGVVADTIAVISAVTGGHA